MPYYIDWALDENKEHSALLINDNYEIVEEVLLFLNHIQVKGLSENTVETYCRSLKEYYNWLEKVELEFNEVKRRNFIGFIKFLKESGERSRSASTINKYIAAVSSFYDYLEKIGGYILEHPTHSKDDSLVSKSKTISSKSFFDKTSRNIFRQKVTKRVDNRRLSRDQIEILFNSIEKVYKEESLVQRNELIFRLLYETGIRISECMGLRIMDYSEPNINEDVGYIYVKRYKDYYHKDHSIKSNERDIPVSMDLIYEIEDYITFHRPYREDTDTIFVSHRGKTKGLFLTRSPITKYFKKISEFSGIYCTPHMMRHTHGTELAENGYDQEYIKDRLGHNSIESTAKYMHISLEAQTEAYQNFLKSRGES